MPRHRQPPPALNSTLDTRNVRCGCGFAYNGYQFGGCPQCKATEFGWFALACLSCRTVFYHSEKVELCPECGSGETTVFCEPEQDDDEDDHPWW